jgi:hypothetical protein
VVSNIEKREIGPSPSCRLAIMMIVGIIKFLVIVGLLSFTESDPVHLVPDYADMNPSHGPEVDKSIVLMKEIKRLFSDHRISITDELDAFRLTIKESSEKLELLRQKLTGLEKIISRMDNRSSALHAFVPDRVSILKQVSSRFDLSACGQPQYVTAVSVVDSTTGLTGVLLPAHFLCSSPPVDVLVCDGVDVVISIHCPHTHALLSLEHVSPALIGDHVIVYAPEVQHQAYSATIGGDVGVTVQNPLFKGLPIFDHQDLYLTLGHQSPGFSGSLVLDSNGVVGLAVATNYQSNDLVVVVPTSKITACIRAKGQRTVQECEVSQNRTYSVLQAPLVDSGSS